MKAEQMRDVCLIAEGGQDLSEVDDSVLHGCALPGFKPVYATLEACAKLLRWQCLCLNGQWDSEAFNELCGIFRRKVTII